MTQNPTAPTPTGVSGLLKIDRPSPGGRRRRAAGRGPAGVVRRRDRLAQLGAADARRAARPRRPRRLLDLHLRQLAPHAAVRPGLGREVRATQGLTVVGVHTPEFGFERDVDNVTRADARASASTTRSRSTATTASGARSPTTSGRRSTSPTREGRIRYHHFGEGEYAMTEMVIQQLLIDAGADGRRPGPRDGRAARASRSPPTGGRCSRPRRTSATARAAASRSEDVARVRRSRTPTPRRRGCASTQWALAGTWTVARARRGARTSRAAGSRSGSTRATSTS